VQPSPAREEGGADSEEDDRKAEEDDRFHGELRTI
jgi:hypothetical protein